MINLLHSTLFRPEDGWDPIAAPHAARYSEFEWEHISDDLINMLEQRMGGFKGKHILDLGGGPGHYSVAFALRGASVLWHDVSHRYQCIAQRCADAHCVSVEFSCGYLEDAARLKACFDLVFCRLCWSYSRSDRAFAKVLFSLVRPGGAGYVEVNTPEFSRSRGVRALQSLLNSKCWLKIGHPYPPHGRIAELLHSYPIESMAIDYHSVETDKVYFVRSKS